MSATGRIKAAFSAGKGRRTYDLARRHPAQAGAIGGLSDTALAVVVGTLTLVGVVGFFQTSSVNAKTNNEVANFTALVGNIRSAYYAAGSSYTGMTDTTLATSRIAPAPLIRGGNSLMSAFNHPIAVAGAASGVTFTISYSTIPDDACVKFLTTVWNTMSDTTVAGATSVNGTVVGRFAMSDATTACSAGGANAIVFTLS
ncbi:type 4 pilus major pilin [Telmatospirillum sp.]|uniref:type 4 pilus major pilin n=1 Tax=Telmatospirillum sp. TaxID=2079197 RepID=UPI00284B523A|nr:type 4 pilus major pilin [Telmatospirillum sp.]MDR3438191.1 type 4 pilus major pilin [Telmatospirillum sp.]